MNDPAPPRPLLQVALAVASAIDVDTVLAGVVRPLLDATGHSRVSVALLDPEGIMMRMAHSVGADPVESGDAVGLQDASPALRQAVLERRAVVADYDAVRDESSAVAAQYDSHLALVVPMTHHGRVLGAIAIDDPGKRVEFTAEDIALAEDAALLAGSAVETARQAEELYRSNEDLAAASRRLEAHMENSPLGIIEFDSEFRIIRWSEEAERIFGWAAVDVMGRRATDMAWVHEEDADLVTEEFHRLLNGVSERSLNINRNYRKDGSIALCEWYNSAIFDRQGKLVSILSEVLDVTDRAAAERTAREREQRLALATDTAQLGLFSWEIATDVLTWENDRAREIFGRDRSESTTPGRAFIDQAVHAHDRDVVQRAVAEGMDTGHIRVTCRMFRASDRTWRWVELAGGIERKDDGQPVRLVGVVRDVTDRQRAEARLFQHSLVLEGINSVLGAALSASSEEELGRVCLQVAEHITASAFGFIAEVGADGMLHDVAMSEIGWHECGMYDKTGHRRPPADLKIHGLHGKVLDDRASLITNEPATHPESIGTPEGHPAINAFLGVPLIREGATVGLLAVANREGGYSREDQTALEALAPAVVQAFERMRAERALRESREDLARAQAVAHIGSWRLDTRTDTLMWSEEAHRIFGIPAGTPLNYSVFLECVHPEDRELVDHCWQEALRGKPYDVEHRIISSREVRWVRERAELEFDEEGELCGGFGTVHDVTAQKAAEAVREDLHAQVEAERARLRQLIDEIPIGFALIDPTGRVLEINAATNAIWAGELPKASDFEGFGVYHGHHRETGRAIQPDEWPAPRAIASGKRIEMIADIERFDGTLRAARIQAVPLTGEDGDISSVVVITEDVQESLERQEFTESLAEIGAAAAAARQARDALSEMLELSARALHADRAVAAVARGSAWAVEQVYASGDADTPPESCEHPLPVDVVAEHKGPVAIEDVLDDPRCDGEQAARLGIRSLVQVPVYGEGRLFGSLVYCYEEPRSFSAAQLDYASRLVDAATIALDAVFAYERERMIAQTLQEAIMSPPKQVEGIEVVHLYQPAAGIADVGGDFFDVFEIAGGKVVIAVGDVSGKGIHAARMTSLVRDGIRAYSYEEPHPALVLERLNSLVYRMSEVTVFATVFLGVLDLSSGLLRHCSAGHPPAVVWHEGIARQIGECRDSVVGAFPSAIYHASRTMLDEGSTLVAFTDGLVEARHGDDLFGEEGLLATLELVAGSPLGEIPDRLYGAARDFAQGALRDDTVVLCVRWRGAGPSADS